MKLRLRSNSIRLRLGPADVRRLIDTGLVESRTHFTPHGPPLTCALRTAHDASSVSASFDGSTVLVTLPLPLARQWANSDQVGIEAAQPATPGDPLRILVEKDFQCLDAAPDEPPTDAYPNPRGKC